MRPRAFLKALAHNWARGAGWISEIRRDDDVISWNTASRRHAGYNLDFLPIPVTLGELEAAQEREYWPMVGDPRW
jgi:hypothetical protein